MADWPLTGVRFALYVDLMLLFGVPLFALHTPGPRIGQGVLAALAVVGLLLSMLSIALMTAAMAGLGLSEVDFASVRMMVVETAIGNAWAVRVASLGLIIGLAWVTPHGATACLAAIALASLAWTGHGAAGEGAAGLVQLGGDIVHLLASAAWVGALAGLTAMLFRRPDVTTARQALERFSRVGTAIVALVLVSGLANTAFLVGWSHLIGLPSTSYGLLLIAKLLLFIAMLGLAALNRFRLTPALAANPTLAALRTSLAIESGAAIAVLALVAWLGTLEPPMSM